MRDAAGTGEITIDTVRSDEANAKPTHEQAYTSAYSAWTSVEGVDLTGFYLEAEKEWNAHIAMTLEMSSSGADLARLKTVYIKLISHQLLTRIKIANVRAQCEEAYLKTDDIFDTTHFVSTMIGCFLPCTDPELKRRGLGYYWHSRLVEKELIDNWDYANVTDADRGAFRQLITRIKIGSARLYKNCSLTRDTPDCSRVMAIVHEELPNGDCSALSSALEPSSFEVMMAGILKIWPGVIIRRPQGTINTEGGYWVLPQITSSVEAAALTPLYTGRLFTSRHTMDNVRRALITRAYVPNVTHNPFA